MTDIPVFDYQTDWVEYFQEFLGKNKVEDKDRNKIKVNIVESNQSINDFLQRNANNFEVRKSKEDFFFNIILRDPINNKPQYLYLNTQSKNSRFWVLHNIEFQTEIQKKIESRFHNSYLQDKIYIPNLGMEFYQQQFCAYSLGLSLKFQNLFSGSDVEQGKTEDSSSPSHQGKLEQRMTLNPLHDAGIAVRVWTQNRHTVTKLIQGLSQISFPINYNYINCVFEDESAEILMKENLFFDGRLTVDRGKDFYQHLKFVDKIRQDYQNQMNLVEDARLNWNAVSGDLFTIQLTGTYDPPALMDQINQHFRDFKIHAFFMYQQDECYLYHCVDSHTGDKFYVNAMADQLQVNLGSKACGNIVFRLLSHLQRYLDPTATLTIGDKPLRWN